MLLIMMMVTVTAIRRHSHSASQPSHSTSLQTQAGLMYENRIRRAWTQISQRRGRIEGLRGPGGSVPRDEHGTRLPRSEEAQTLATKDEINNAQQCHQQQLQPWDQSRHLHVQERRGAREATPSNYPLYRKVPTVWWRRPQPPHDSACHRSGLFQNLDAVLTNSVLKASTLGGETRSATQGTALAAEQRKQIQDIRKEHKWRRRFGASSISATIGTRWEIQCLPYAGFKTTRVEKTIFVTP